MKMPKMLRMKKEDKAKIIAFSGAIFFTFALVGFLGLIICLNLFLTVPLLIGLVANANNGKTTGQKISGWWADRSRAQKIGIGIGFGLLIPFIMIGFTWILIMGTAFALDVLIVVPVVMVVGFFVFRKARTKPDAHAVAKIFGHPIVGVVGIIGVLLIVMMAGFNYVDYHKWDNARTNFSNYASPLHTTPGDVETTFIPFYNETSGNWENMTATVQKVTGVIIFHVVDDYFNQAGFQTNLESHNYTSNSTVILEDTDGHVDVNRAGVSLASLDKEDGVSIINIGGYTDSQGLISFNDVPFGIYEMTVDGNGYAKFNVEIHINETFEEATVFIHLRPIYYKIQVDYLFAKELTEKPAFIFGEYEYAEGHVYLSGQFVGGINKADWNNIKRQNSWYGWTGLAIPNFTNSMLKVNHQLKNSMNLFFLVPLAVAIISFTGAGAIATLEKEADVIYGGHKIVVKDLAVIDAQRFEYASFWRQLPTGNSQIVGAEFPSGNDTITQSSMYSRTYQYVVWGQAPNSNEFRMQFNAST